MIVFGTPVSEPEAYHRYAGPGIRRVAEPDSLVNAFSAVGPIARGYNLLLEAAAREADLEMAVLVHPHAEITDGRFLTVLRETFRADPDVAVVGCAGASGVRGVAWWEGTVHVGPVVHRYQTNGGGEFPAYAWANPQPAPAEVDVVDGHLLALSPWATRELRFDENLWLGPGYDVDFCLRARQAGHKVVVADLGVTFHRSLELVGEAQVLTAAQVALAEKWDGFAGASTDWRARARRAEAEREAARAEAYFRQLAAEARVDVLEAQLEATTSAPGWKLTEPLRRANHWRRQRQS